MKKRFFMSNPYLDGGEEEANGYYLAHEVDETIKKLVIENRKLRDLLGSIKIHCEQVDKTETQNEYKSVTQTWKNVEKAEEIIRNAEKTK